MDIHELDKYFNNVVIISSTNLRTKLIQYGVKDYKCERCCQTEWLDVPIPLELHHKDGNHQNNALSNLEILCPNCHALTSNHRGKKKNKTRTDAVYTGEAWKNAIISSPNAKQAIEKMGLKGKGSNYILLNRMLSKLNVKYRAYTEEELALRRNKMKRIGKIKRISVPKALKVKTPKWYDQIDLKKLAQQVWEIPVEQLQKQYGITGLKMFLQRKNIQTPPPGYWRKLQTGRGDECKQIKEKMVGTSGFEPPLQAF